MGVQYCRIDISARQLDSNEMQTLGLFEVKNRLSELCERVSREGEPLVVTRHGRPLVRIVPYEEGGKGDSVWRTVEECRQRYGPLTEEFELPTREVGKNRGDPLA